MSIGIGSGATQYQSYNSSAEKYGSYGSRFDSETQNIGLAADQASSRYKDINLEDGKSS